MYNVMCVARNISKWLHHDYIDKFEIKPLKGYRLQGIY